jgi:hypothetical protein
VDVERARATISAQAPRPLRLAELLRELGARADAAQSAGATPPDPPRATLTVGDLVDKAAASGFGFLVGVLTLIAIPFVGLSTPFGLAIALVGAQLASGMSRPWLPGRARRREVSMAMLDRVLALLVRRTRWLSRATRRRMKLLVTPRLVGLAIVLLGLGLALPLPIPGSNMVFLVPLFVYAIGLLEGDGMWIAFGHLGTALDIALLIAFGDVVARVLRHAWHWIA